MQFFWGSRKTSSSWGQDFAWDI
uniref:Uncharacterized protein n=1 Tax=Arundo donax TaxID=35708 RepID=A0A0A8Z4W8_ARUDO